MRMGRWLVCGAAIVLGLLIVQNVPSISPMPIVADAFAAEVYRYEDGAAAWDAGRPEVAIVLWLRAAAQGDARSAARLGEAFERGEEVPQHSVAAAYYHGLAARAGDAASQAKLSKLTKSFSTDEKEQLTTLSERPLAVSGTKVPMSPGTASVALLEAAIAGDIDAAKAAIAAKAALTRMDSHGHTALSYATLGGNADMVGLLVRAGARTNVQNGEGYTALHLAALAGNADIVGLLCGTGKVTRHFTSPHSQGHARPHLYWLSTAPARRSLPRVG
jgi:hypothetical protein